MEEQNSICQDCKLKGLREISARPRSDAARLLRVLEYSVQYITLAEPS